MSNIPTERLNVQMRQVLRRKVETKGGDLGSITFWGTLGQGACAG